MFLLFPSGGDVLVWSWHFAELMLCSCEKFTDRQRLSYALLNIFGYSGNNRPFFLEHRSYIGGIYAGFGQMLAIGRLLAYVSPQTQRAPANDRPYLGRFFK